MMSDSLTLPDLGAPARGAQRDARPGQRRRARRAPLGLLVALPVWLLQVGPPEGTARAQDFAAAGQRFATAQEAFAKGDFGKAAREFQAAYDITQDPSLLFNIGESWQRAGDNGKALSSYRAYLKAQPDATDRAEVEKRIKALEEAGVAAAPAGAPAPPAGTPTGGAGQGGAEAGILGGAPATGLVTAAGGGDRPSSALRTVAWGGVALTVAVLTAGAVLGLGAQNRADELVRRTSVFVGGKPPVYTQSEREAYESLKSEGSAYNTAAIACYAVAGASAIVSTALFIADYRKSRAARPAVALSPSRLTLTWRF